MTLSTSAPLISFSVVINTCDRRDSLRGLLRALREQTYERFEVVVVVGPTRDDTYDMLAAEFTDRVVVVRCPEFNLSVSRNLGLEHAAADVVAFIDDDAVPAPTWLEQLAAPYRRPEVAAVGGRTYNVSKGELQFLSGLISALGKQEDVREDPEAPLPSTSPDFTWFTRLHGCNMSYRREALADIGGFDVRYEYLFDDSDVGVRLGLAGRLVQSLRDAVVYHQPGTGRNRGRLTYDVNWYCWLRSTIYFTLKNGIPVAGRRTAIRYAYGHVRKFYSDVRMIGDRGDLPGKLYPQALRMLRRATLDGFVQGLFASRRLAASIAEPQRDLLPFQDRRSTRPMPRRQELLRICLLSAEYPPRSTHGIARHTHNMVLGLVGLGHEVHVVTVGERTGVRHQDGAYVHTVPVVARPPYDRLPAMGYEDLASWLAYSHAAYDCVEGLRRNHGIQLVDSPLWNLDGLVTAVDGKLPVAIRIATAMKQIAEIHGRQTAEHALMGELETRFLEMAGAWIANSEASVRALREVYGLDPGRTLCEVVPHGIVPRPEEEVEPLDGRAAGPVTVLFVGRLEGRKGILDLFSAIPRVLESAPDARFVIAGSDNSAEDGFRAREGMDYASYFHRRYPQHRERVEFTGFVDESALDDLYRRCDVFVAPSLYESFGLIYLEAMNQARPVIACRAGGPQEIVVDGETGLLVPPADGEALAAALSRLVVDSRLRATMGREGRARLLERYTHEEMARGFVEIYRRMIV